jgi:hypothetical protein
LTISENQVDTSWSRYQLKVMLLVLHRLLAAEAAADAEDEQRQDGPLLQAELLPNVKCAWPIGA